MTGQQRCHLGEDTLRQCAGILQDAIYTHQHDMFPKNMSKDLKLGITIPSDLGEFLFIVPATLDSVGLKVLVPKGVIISGRRHCENPIEL